MTKIPEFNKGQAITIGVALVVLYVLVRGFGGAAKDASKAAVNVAGGVVAGAAVGIGEAFGLPDTSMTECAKAQAEGRTLDASILCPASTFIKGLFS